MIILGGQTALRFKNRELFLCICFLYLFLIPLLQVSLSNHPLSVALLGIACLLERCETEGLRRLQSAQALLAMKLTRNHCYLQH